MHWLMNYVADISFCPYRIYSACSNFGLCHVDWNAFAYLLTWLKPDCATSTSFFFFTFTLIKWKISIFSGHLASLKGWLYLSCGQTFWLFLDIINQRMEILYFVVKISWKPCRCPLFSSLSIELLQTISVFLGKVYDCWITKGNE